VTIPKAIPIMAYSRNLCITAISYCDFYFCAGIFVPAYVIVSFLSSSKLN